MNIQHLATIRKFEWLGEMRPPQLNAVACGDMCVEWSADELEWCCYFYSTYIIVAQERLRAEAVAVRVALRESGWRRSNKNDER